MKPPEHTRPPRESAPESAPEHAAAPDPETFGAWLRYAAFKQDVELPSVVLRQVAQELREADVHRGCRGCAGGVEFAAVKIETAANRWAQWEAMLAANRLTLPFAARGDCVD